MDSRSKPSTSAAKHQLCGIADLAPQVEDALRKLSELQDVNSDLQVNNPQVRVEVNWAQAATLGLDVNQIETALGYAYVTQQVSTIYAPDSQYELILGVQPQYQQNADALNLRVVLNIYAFVGIILLIGIVKKNGIMMVDFAVVARHQGKSPYNAIYEACLVRFRPIMMTTMAALMGTLPIALGIGAGADARRPLGLAVVGGLLFSQFLTLYLTPVFYTYMESWQEKLSKWRWKNAKLKMQN